MRCLFVLCFFLISKTHFAQSIFGTITDAHSGDSIGMANLVVKKQNVVIHGTASDLKGQFILDLHLPGIYDVQISFVGYKTQTITQIEVFKSDPTHLNVQLEKDNELLKGVVVEWDAPIIDPDKGTSCYTTCTFPTACSGVGNATNIWRRNTTDFNPNFGTIDLRSMSSGQIIYLHAPKIQRNPFRSNKREFDVRKSCYFH